MRRLLDDGAVREGFSFFADARGVGLAEGTRSGDPRRDTALAVLQEQVERAGGLVLPALVDAHVHLREPGQADREGILNGTRAAAAGGVTTVLDMPNNVPPCDSAARLERKKERFRRKSQVRWGLHVLARQPAPENGGFASGKIDMSAAGASAAVFAVDRLLPLFAAYRVISVHAEDQRFFRPGLGRPHPETRPREAVTGALESLETVLRRLPPDRRPRLVLCHAATLEEVAWIRRLKGEGFDIWGETCAHYLVWSQERLLEKGRPEAWYRVNPPIRGEADRTALREALRDGTLDFVSSDHAPHRPADKNSGRPPSGIAGIEWTLPVLLDLVDEGLLSWNRLLDVSARAASAAYGIRGGSEDFVVVAPCGGMASAPVTRAGVDPYGPLGWKVVATVAAGAFVALSPLSPLKTDHRRLLLGAAEVVRSRWFFPTSRRPAAPEVFFP